MHILYQKITKTKTKSLRKDNLKYLTAKEQSQMKKTRKIFWQIELQYMKSYKLQANPTSSLNCSGVQHNTILSSRGLVQTVLNIFHHVKLTARTLNLYHPLYFKTKQNKNKSWKHVLHPPNSTKVRVNAEQTFQQRSLSQRKSTLHIEIIKMLSGYTSKRNMMMTNKVWIWSIWQLKNSCFLDPSTLHG